MPKREPMSSVDTAWLRMDRPTNPMVVVGLMGLEEKLSLDRLKQIIASRFLRHRRFRDRVVMERDSAYWERDSHFDLSAHVKRTALPHPARKQELQDLVSDLANTPLDPARPLWQFHLVDEYDGGSALIARIYHCYADGIALARVLLSLTDGATPGADAPVEAEERKGGDFLQDWLAPITGPLSSTLKVGGGLLDALSDVVLHPTHALDYARQGIDIAAEAARLALMPMDSPSRFKGTPMGVKRAAWTDRLPLHEIKAVAQATGCSINDIVLSCAAGALRAYLGDKGDPLDGVESRAVVPVNMRPESELGGLSNYFGMIAVLLPLGLANPLERLYEVKRRMLELKASRQAQVTLGLLAAVGMGPKALQQKVLDLLISRATVIITNVPGPQQPLYMAGARLKEVVFWVPQSGDIGMGMSVLSYNDGVQFGITTDTSLVADPENIARLFAQQFEHLLWIALLGSWETPPDPELLGKLSLR
jgi:diacylglycerol O-acyltransferase / wax synthase